MDGVMGDRFQTWVIWIVTAAIFCMVLAAYFRH